MKVTSIELISENSFNSVVLSFRDPGATNPYNVKTITGLDAGLVIPKYYGTSRSGDKRLYNLTLNPRQVVMRVALNPDFTNNLGYSELRDELYKKIASSRSGLVQIQFKHGVEVIAAVSGFISKFESFGFDKAPDVQITIDCNDGMLRGIVPINVDVSGLDTSDTNLTDYISTSPHGFTFVAQISTPSSIPAITITDYTNDNTWLEIIPTGEFLDGDVLYFSSEYNKYLYIIRNGIIINLADVITPNAVWPHMFPGDNNYMFTPAPNITWESIQYYPTYWGV